MNDYKPKSLESTVSNQAQERLLDKKARLFKSPLRWTKYRLEKPVRNLAAFGIKQYRTKKDNKYWRFAALSLMSLYYGCLLPREQRKWARKMGLKDESIFTKLQTTVGYLTLPLVEHTAIFVFSSNTPMPADDWFFWANLATGFTINTGRIYLAFRKSKPSPAISAPSLVVNGFHYGGKGLKSLIKKPRRKTKDYQI